MSALADTVDDRYAERLAIGAPSPLREFNQGGVLSAADVHVATLLGRLAAIDEPGVLLAAALAVRAPRLGHVFVDLESVARTAVVESAEELDPALLAWPEPAGWISRVAACEPLVACGEPDDTAAGPSSVEVRPLRLIGTRLYLDLHWRQERQVATYLRALAGAGLQAVDVPQLAAGISRLFAEAEDSDQRVAVASAMLRRFAVIAGGPGSGKTTTVTKVIALLLEQALASGARSPVVALCAPTGKAAARLQESVHGEALRLDVEPAVRDALQSLRATTIHRLLGWPRTSHGRLGHDQANPLPHDLVVVDETSMVSLMLIARLLAAVRDDARLLLVGDVEQLTAIEAGAVLRDVVGPAAQRPRMTAGMRAAVALAAGVEPEVEPVGGGAVFEPEVDRVGGGSESGASTRPPFGDGIVVLRGVHRFGAGIAGLADTIRRGDAGAVIEALSAAGTIEWLTPEMALHPVREAALAAASATVQAAREGDGRAALTRLGTFRLLCAHRHGPHGVSTWSATVERWLAESIPLFVAGAPSYAGQPLLITRNDYELRLYNGDMGVVVESEPGTLSAVFERDGRLVAFAPSRLQDVQRAHAMTIHKSQGSQFDAVAIVLGEPDSRILTRELLYTAVTRARRRVILVASEDAVRTAVARPVARATGLRERLWG